MNGGEGSAVGIRNARQAELSLGGPSLPAKDLAEEHGPDAGTQLRVVGEDEPERNRKAQNPLPNRYVRDDEIDQPCCSLDHATAQA